MQPDILQELLVQQAPGDPGFWALAARRYPRGWLRRGHDFCTLTLVMLCDSAPRFILPPRKPRAGVEVITQKLWFSAPNCFHRRCGPVSAHGLREPRHQPRGDSHRFLLSRQLITRAAKAIRISTHVSTVYMTPLPFTLIPGRVSLFSYRVGRGFDASCGIVARGGRRATRTVGPRRAPVVRASEQRAQPWAAPGQLRYP